VVVVRDASLAGSTTRIGTLRDLAALCAADSAEGAEGTIAGPAVILLGEALRAGVAVGELEQHLSEVSIQQLRRQLAG
jgi:hypothetical protein